MQAIQVRQVVKFATRGVASDSKLLACHVESHMNSRGKAGANKHR